MPRRRKTPAEIEQEAKARFDVARARRIEAERELANERAGIIGRWEFQQAMENDKVLLRLREAMLPTLGKRDRAAFEGFFDRLDGAPASAPAAAADALPTAASETPEKPAAGNDDREAA